MAVSQPKPWLRVRKRFILLDRERYSALARTVYHGNAKFTGAKTVNVGDVILKVANIFINVEARATGRNILIGKLAMSRVGRAKESSQTQGFMKVLVDAENKQILGAAILGLNGDEAIHCITDTMYAKAPYTVIQRAVHIHPTVPN
jgi:pyruvate/2-oxoglutarate dehydrogenase complex dihydrolipoamide dehydrogenase (E3) component